MNLKQKIGAGMVLGALAFAAPDARADLYDDFSSGSLNPAKWEVRQDPEGQPHLDEYFVANESGNFVFHTQQNSLADRRTYLVPTHTFSTGDTISWEVDVKSREGHYGNIILVVGEEWTGLHPHRAIFGAVGYNNGPQPFDELGITRPSITFYNDRVEMNTLSPSGQLVTHDIPLQNPNGNYELYIGSFTGHNGRAHMDYDNFHLVPEPSSLMLLAGSSLVAFRKR
jgi:hypothetical protein